MRSRWLIPVGLYLAFLTGIAGAGTDPEIGKFESLIKAGKYEDAREELLTYSARHPDSWQALYQLGFVNFRLHRLQESVDALCKSILQKKDFADSHKILAYDLNMLGHPELAKPELELTIQIDPSSSESHYELGRIDYEQGNYAAAVTELETAKALAPELVRVYHNLGLTYSALHDDTQAVRNFEDGLKWNDAQERRSAWPLIDYATYLNTQSQFQKARDLLLRAATIDTSWDREFEELSKAYRGMGQIPDAIRALEKAIALNPNKAEFHYVLSRLYLQVHRDAEAKTELDLYQHTQHTAAK